MAKEGKVGGGYVKKETMLAVTFIALVVGFLGGVVYSSFKIESGVPVQTSVPPQQKFKDQKRVSAEQADRIRAYKKSLELNNNNANVWTDLGVMYRRSGQPEKAIKAFDKAMEIDPRHEISRFNKGIVLLHDLNDREGAIQAWEELVKVNPFAKAPNGQPVKDIVKKFKESMNR